MLLDLFADDSITLDLFADDSFEFEFASVSTDDDVDFVDDIDVVDVVDVAGIDEFGEVVVFADTVDLIETVDVIGQFLHSLKAVISTGNSGKEEAFLTSSTEGTGTLSTEGSEEVLNGML